MNIYIIREKVIATYDNNHWKSSNSSTLSHRHRLKIGLISFNRLLLCFYVTDYFNFFSFSNLVLETYKYFCGWDLGPRVLRKFW